MSRKFVLIAEDEETSRFILSKMLESLGHDVVKCSNGLTAFRVLLENPDVGLLITDVAMPVMDGIELIKNVRETEHIRDVPIIIISGVVSIKEIKNLLEIGASKFMPKPVNAEFLKQYVNEVMA